MKIIIVGAGKVGVTIAEQLCREDHDITIIDIRGDRLAQTGERFDVMTVEGNGSTYEVQIEAGVQNADLFIAAASSDELNLLCCLIAKKNGAKNTIARVRNPEFRKEIDLIKDDLGLSMVFNPEMQTALEMSRILRLPSAIKIDTFAKGRVELLKIMLTQDSPLVGKTLIDIGKLGYRVLVCAVERGEQEVYIPAGSFRLAAGDRISFVSKPKEAQTFLKKIGILSSPVQQLMLIGGSRMAVYLAGIMQEYGASVKIIDSNPEVCERLAEVLPKASIVLGDGTDQQLLLEEGIAQTDAFASLTGLDEENILVSLYAGRVSGGKVITKVARRSFGDIVTSLGLSSVFYPSSIAAEVISRYVRALQNSFGSNVETLYQIVDGKAEALEFRVSAESRVCHVPLQQLTLRENLLIACINRKGMIITPRGSDTIEAGDTVIVVTTNTGLKDLDDILDKHRS